MTWFDTLFGFAEHSPERVREMLRYEGGAIHSAANGAVLPCGVFSTPSLAELRAACPLDRRSAPSTVGEVVADVQDLHRKYSNNHALFQVASQFNALEMTGPDVCPEHGITAYQFDRTQGPACSIACGAATAYRNYFIELDGQIGQSRERQVDTLAALGEKLGNHDGKLWNMQNGYAWMQMASTNSAAPCKSDCTTTSA